MTKNIFFLIFILIFADSTLNIEISNAQWVKTHSVLTSSRSFTSNGNYIFAGWPGVWYSTNNGNNWINTSLNDGNISSLSFCGSILFAGSSVNGVYYSINNGTNWLQTSLNNRGVSALLTINDSTILAGGNATGYPYTTLFISSDKGSTWNHTDLDSSNVNCLSSNGTIFYAGTYNRGVYKSSNGVNWTRTSLDNRGIYSLAALGSYVFAGTFEFGVYRSTNYGTTWTQTTLNNRNISALTIKDSNIFAGCATANGISVGVYMSTFNGSTWFQKNQGFNNPLPPIYDFLITNNYIFAGTSSGVWRRTYIEAIGIQKINTSIPNDYSLFQNYPNPFNPKTNIRFDLPKSGIVKLIVYDILGKEVSSLVNEKLQPGKYEVNFDASDLSSGIYIYTLKAGDFADTKKMILIK